MRHLDTVGFAGALIALGLVLGIPLARSLSPDVDSNAAAWVQAIGSVGAIAAAIWINWSQHRKDRALVDLAQMTKRRSVAKAVLREMMQAINHQEAALKALAEASRHVAKVHPSLTVAALQMMKPLYRPVWQNLGGEVAAMSGVAASNAVAFDGATQLLERTYDRLLATVPPGQAPIVICSELAINVRNYARTIEGNFIAVAHEADELNGDEVKGFLSALDRLKYA